MTRLFLVRHSESEWNALKRWQGQADPPLTAHGRAMAERAAVALTDVPGSIVSSPLLRALATAEIFASKLGRGNPSVVGDLQEMDVGGFSGLTGEEIAEKFPADMEMLRAGTLERWPGGETRAGFGERIFAALRRLVNECDEDQIIVVTHGGAIQSIERRLDVHPGVGIDLLEGRWFELGPALTVDGERVRLLD